MQAESQHNFQRINIKRRKKRHVVGFVSRSERPNCGGVVSRQVEALNNCNGRRNAEKLDQIIERLMQRRIFVVI